jgi:hypothetical protein
LAQVGKDTQKGNNKKHSAFAGFVLEVGEKWQIS